MGRDELGLGGVGGRRDGLGKKGRIGVGRDSGMGRRRVGIIGRVRWVER